MNARIGRDAPLGLLCVLSFFIVSLALVLTPAIDAGATVPLCGSTAAPLCDGECPPGDTCLDGGGTCVCATTGTPCSIAGAPTCAGECAAGTACTDTGGSCACLPGPLCGAATAPACNGECPPAAACVDVGGSCACAAAGIACGFIAGAPSCWGQCALGTACFDISGICTCAMPSTTTSTSTTTTTTTTVTTTTLPQTPLVSPLGGAALVALLGSALGRGRSRRVRISLR